MSSDNTINHDSSPLAAEYVLGVLGTPERRTFEQRLAQEPALRREVEFWQERLGALVSEVTPVEPPAAAWNRIDAAIASQSAPATSLWNNLSLWRWATIGSSMIAAASLAFVAVIVRGIGSMPPLVAKLDSNAGQTGFVASVDPSRQGLTIVPAAITNLNQRVLELWLIQPNDKPRSLGLIETGRPIHINIPSDLVRGITFDATLAVSLEPPGGSPTGQPTGPVVATGKLTNL